MNPVPMAGAPELKENDSSSARDDLPFINLLFLSNPMMG
jgi:hypothetical protein